jgi:hypothetical protein
MKSALPRYPVGFAVALSDEAVIHAVVSDAHAAEASGASGSVADSRTVPPPQFLPFCKWKQNACAVFKRAPYSVTNVRESMAFSAQFCRDCKPLLIASHQNAVEGAFDNDS